MMRNAAILIALLVLSEVAMARTRAVLHPASVLPDATRTARYFDSIADSPPRLRLFLQAMPKGGDLHNHAGGTVYAEDYLRWAAADGLCIATDPYRIVEPPCDAPNRLPASGLERDYPHYSAAIDGLSTRGFEAGVGDRQRSGYDRFFATFDAVAPVSHRNPGKELAATREQAAADHVSYVEQSVGAHAATVLAAQVGNADPADFPALASRLAPLMPAAISSARADFNAIEAQAAAIDSCNGPQAKRACQVEVRYLYQTIRTRPPAQVFAQLALGFALAESDPRFVGINIAAPEHDPIAVRDYSLHMQMIGWLKAHHPTVQISLHAGELTLGLVPPRELTFHIRDAVEVAGARRIGHGVDIAYEADATNLLKRMAHDQVAVEINLTSNAVILGVKGRDHPLSLYREAGVPLVLSTDDEGVSRSDMTNEYLRAVTEQGLHYKDLKQIVRDGLQFAFLPGASLWEHRAGGPRVPACAAEQAPSCIAYVGRSPKAYLQLQLERDLTAFEAVRH